MDDDKDLRNIDLNTSPSFDLSNSEVEAQPSLPQHTDATATIPPSSSSSDDQSQIPKPGQPRKVETASWLQGGSTGISQRELIERQMAAKQKEQGEDAIPVMIQGDSFGSDEGDKRERLSIKDRVRKTAVAVTGSAIVASGTVMLVTPAHPFGHAVQVAGLSVLATEFDGPKEALTKTKARASGLAKRLSGATRKSGSETNEETQKKSEPLPLGPSPLRDTSELQRTLASKDYVSPFRKTSIPPNAQKDPKQKKGKPEKKQIEEKTIPKPTFNRQGSTSLSEVTPINAKDAKKAAKQKAKKPIPTPTLKRQGSTSLSGGI